MWPASGRRTCYGARGPGGEKRALTCRCCRHCLRLSLSLQLSLMGSASYLTDPTL